MPRHLVEGDLAQGRLLLVNLPEETSVDYRLSALWRKNRLQGPATAWLLQTLEKSVDWLQSLGNGCFGQQCSTIT